LDPTQLGVPVRIACLPDGIGGLLGVERLPTTTAANQALLGWSRSLGMVVGNGSYRALGRHVFLGGVAVVERSTNRTAGSARGKRLNANERAHGSGEAGA
jgi:hypothetical protein